MSFSERMGHISAPEALQLDGMTDKLSNQLFNFCTHVTALNGTTWKTIEDHFNSELGRRFDDLKFTDYYPSFDQSHFTNTYDNLEWHEKYTLVEIVIKYMAEKASIGRTVLIGRLNNHLEKENSGYRMNQNFELWPITNPEEIDTLITAGSTGIDTIDDGIQKALTCFANRQNPDYPNTIKEAMSALEALAQLLTNSPNRSLSKIVNKMPIDQKLKDVIKKLFDYASDVGGIRHTKQPGEDEPNFADAHFALVTIAAIINYINRTQ